MFTGIIEELGIIKHISNHGSSLSLTIGGHKIFDDLKVGDSVAVNGVCLTATTVTDKEFTADVMPESIKMTTLLNLKSDSIVNLERAMAANGRFGGHLVAGHVDGTGTITKVEADDTAVIFHIETTKNIMDYIIYKGSIAIDGTSLTVSSVSDRSFTVSLIPHTQAETLLGKSSVGTLVNLETDITGRYIHHFMKLGALSEKEEESKITYDMLRENGFL